MEGNKVNHLTITVALCCESHPTRQSFVYDGNGTCRSEEISQGESTAGKKLKTLDRPCSISLRI